MRRLIIPLLVVALLITGYFAYNQYQLNQDLTRRAESQYQRSFHELVWNVDTINSQLAKTLVTSSPEQIMQSLTNLLRETFAASSNLGGIPIAMVELEKTEKLLNDIADYSYYILKRNNLDGKELSEEEWEKLQELYKRCRVVRDELDQIEAKVLDRDLSFVEVETVALRKGKKLKDNTIIEGFTTIENKVKAFPDLQFDEGIQKIEPEPQPLSGEEITEEQAAELARKFMNEHDGPVARAEVAFDTEGRIPVYGVAIYKEREDTPSYLEVTKRGGHILQMYIQRKIQEANLDYNEAEKEARKFLNTHGFQNLVLVETDSDTNVANFTFVPTQEGVLLYPDMLKVNVALDNGQVISFDQTSFLSYHRNRDIPQPELSEEQISAKINPNLRVEHIRLALIPSEYEKRELLTYEVKGKINDETFLLFIDAKTGEENRIVRLTKPREFKITVR